MRGTKPILRPDDAAFDAHVAAPDWLDAAARAEWDRVMPELVQRKILTPADLGTLENYCLAIGQVRACQKLISERGLVLSNAKGTRKHPAVQIQAGAMTQARQLAAELGLTPVSRSRPSIRDDGDDDSLLG